MADERIINALTRHQVFLQRFGGGQINEIVPVLERMRDQIKLRIMDANTAFQQRRLSDLLTSIEEIMDASGQQMREQLVANLEEFGEYESGFVARMLNSATVEDFSPATPAPEQVAASVTQSVMRITQGSNVLQMSVPQLIDAFTSSKREQVLDSVRQSYIEGATQQQMVSRVTEIVDKQAKRQAGAMIRTAVNHMGSEARRKTFEANVDVLDGEVWVAVLDARTTFICMSRDQIVYPVGSGPYPPAHYACRSVRAPEVKEEFSLFRSTGERASTKGPVSADMTYGEWLAKQPQSFQAEALGTERAKLFREGKVSVDKFVDDQGFVLSLDELRQREGLALQD